MDHLTEGFAGLHVAGLLQGHKHLADSSCMQEHQQKESTEGPTCKQKGLVLVSKGQQHHLQGAGLLLESLHINSDLLQLCLLCCRSIADIDLAGQGDCTQLDVDLVPLLQLFTAADSLAVVCSIIRASG